MLKISFILKTEKINFNKNAPLDLESIKTKMIISDGEDEDVVGIYLADFYVKIVKWLKEIKEIEFKDFSYCDTTDFYPLISIEKDEDMVRFDSLGYAWLMSEEEVMLLASQVIEDIEKQFENYGADGVGFLEKIKEIC